jgi:alpha/beta hydrolase family protein
MTTEIVPLRALDGQALTLVHITGTAAPTRGPVLMVHGAGVRADIFRPPLPHTIVDALVEAGWDVWLLNWRASIDLEPVSWTLDDGAAYDFPAAVQAVLQHTGAHSLKAIVHCVGSASFTMAAVSGLLPQVDTVISNALSLHPVVPRGSNFKLQYLAPLLGRFSPHVSPSWGNRTEGWFSKAVTLSVRATHRECDNTVCRLASFAYGSGGPALWSHANLDAATHEWIRGEFAEVPLTFFDQMARSTKAGNMVPVAGYPDLPTSYLDSAPKTDARFVFLAGEDNRCFLPESQQRTYEFFQQHRPGKDALHRIRGYGHLDVFLGRHASDDTFPLILEELAR